MRLGKNPRVKELTWEDAVLTNGWQFMDSFSKERRKVDKYQSGPKIQTIEETRPRTATK